MKITVKRQHIDNGIALSSSCCPIALACKDAGLKNVWITGMMIQCRLNDNSIVQIPLPVLAIEFISNFDSGRYVTMCSFDLPITQK
jgi:hypothetical protein